MRAATAQQQQSRGGGQHHHPNSRSFSNAHNRKASAASSASSSSGAAAAASNNTQPGSTSGSTTPSTTVSNNNDATTLTLSSVIGSQLRLTLNAGARDKERPVVEGQLWCYDPAYGSLVLRTPSSSNDSNRHNYRIVRLSNIASVTVLQPADPQTAAAVADIPLKPMDVNRLQDREAEAVREEAKRIANEPPPGVSELGKALYEALGKTLPVRWANKTIVVMDEVLVEAPYAPDSQCIKSNNAQRRDRVMKVIIGETEKLKRTQPEILTQ